MHEESKETNMTKKHSPESVSNKSEHSFFVFVLTSDVLEKKTQSTTISTRV